MTGNNKEGTEHDTGGTVHIGAGINGEVWPCPSCEKHESVKFLSGAEYRYYCRDCHIEFEERSQETGTQQEETEVKNE